jgi:CheY-like chemotaxis protein
VTQALSILIEASGYRVRTASDVASALAAARAERPAALLVDLTLPDGDGLAIVTALASEPEPPRFVVALTGHDDPATEARCRAAGCDGVWVKPVRSAVVVAGLRDGLGR